MHRQTTKRLEQHAVKPQLATVSELLDADGHPLMPGSRLIAIGAEQPIPPRQVEAEIAISLADQDRMVDAVHVRRDPEPTKPAIKPNRNTDVAMVEHRGCVEQDLEDEHAHGRRTQRRDNAELDQHGENDLYRVEASTCGHVNVEIGMMHPVQSPKRGYRVKHHMLQIDRQVQ